MRDTAAIPRNYSRSTDIFSQIMIAIIGGVMVFFLLLLGVIIAFNISNQGKIYPGVSVDGVDLSGLEPAAAANLLEKKLNYPSQGKILFRDGEKMWLASPSQLGFYLDPQASALAAYRYGRSENPLVRSFHQFKAWYLGTSLPPLYVFDERAAQSFLTGLAQQNDVPKVEASLSIEGTEVIARAGQIGRLLNIPTTLETLRAQLRSMRDGEISLVIDEDKPLIMNVDQQAEVARQILSQPLVLTTPDSAKGDQGPWTIDPEVLAKLLTIERVSNPDGENYRVVLQAEGLRSLLENIAPRVYRSRENARFIFNDDTRQLDLIQPAKIGRSLNVDGTIATINQKLMAGDHKIPLDLEITQPDVGDDAKAKKLGITELVSSYTSYFYGSSAERIQNIATASARFHGLLVPPGATFSMGDALGDVSLDNGYAEALIIYGNRTIKGVGGGVCQVSTTLFRTVFFGGYPIVERYPHAYRVAYYELTASGGVDQDLAGLDATVFMPLVDFKFTNDTPYWLLMETYVNEAARTLTWKFYSTSDGRQVEWNTSGLKNVVDPPDPVYEENPDLSRGEIKQVDWEVAGADVTVTRTVTRSGEVLYSDTISTHYMPWGAVYQYGPGTENMPPDKKGKKNRKP